PAHGGGRRRQGGGPGGRGRAGERHRRDRGTAAVPLRRPDPSGARRAQRSPGGGGRPPRTVLRGRARRALADPGRRRPTRRDPLSGVAGAAGVLAARKEYSGVLPPARRTEGPLPQALQSSPGTKRVRATSASRAVMGAACGTAEAHALSHRNKIRPTPAKRQRSIVPAPSPPSGCSTARGHGLVVQPEAGLQALPKTVLNLCQREYGSPPATKAHDRSTWDEVAVVCPFPVVDAADDLPNIGAIHPSQHCSV